MHALGKRRGMEPGAQGAWARDAQQDGGRGVQHRVHAGASVRTRRHGGSRVRVNACEMEQQAPASQASGHWPRLL